MTTKILSGQGTVSFISLYWNQKRISKPCETVPLLGNGKIKLCFKSCYSSKFFKYLILQKICLTKQSRIGNLAPLK
jgi:hypothetical protein